MLQSKKSFKLDRNKTYQISGDFRAKAGTPASRIYIGLVPLDKQGMEILPASVNAIYLLETRLTQPAEKGSKVIYVKNATHWNINNRLFWVAFKIRAEYADLPNTNLVPAAAVRPSKEDAGWKVTLAKPLTES